MNLQQLKVMAKKILDLPTAAPGGYKEMAFTTRTGDIANRAGLTPLRESERFMYETQNCGDAKSREFVVLAQDLGVKDSDGKDIMEASCGTLFVTIRSPTSPTSFDDLVLRAPKFE